MRGSRRPAMSGVASAPARVTLGGEVPRRRRRPALLLGFLAGRGLATGLVSFFGPRLAGTFGLAVPTAEAGGPASRPARPTPEISSGLDIDGLWFRVDALGKETAEVLAEAARL